GKRGINTGTDTSDLDRVELLETVERPWFDRLVQRGDGGQRNELPLRSAHVVVEQLLGIEPLAALDLRDDAITAAIVDEAVHITAAEHRAEVAGYVGEAEPHGRDLVLVDIDRNLRQIEFQIAVGEVEGGRTAAGIGLGVGVE